MIKVKLSVWFWSIGACAKKQRPSANFQAVSGIAALVLEVQCRYQRLRVDDSTTSIFFISSKSVLACVGNCRLDRASLFVDDFFFVAAADVVVLLMLSIRLRPIERFAFVQRDENANRTAARQKSAQFGAIRRLKVMQSKARRR